MGHINVIENIIYVKIYVEKWERIEYLTLHLWLLPQLIVAVRALVTGRGRLSQVPWMGRNNIIEKSIIRKVYVLKMEKERVSYPALVLVAAA
jgi:hypothetical protein